MLARGQRIICILGFETSPYGEGVPRKGAIYHVRGFDESGFEGPSIWLDEIVNTPRDYLWADQSIRHQECSWAVDCFRPVIERPTSISMFTAMLTPAPKQTVRA